MRAALAAIAALLPRKDDYAGLRRSWRADLTAGVTVAVVALPLALGFGLSSGLTAEAGLITAIVAGLVAAVFGGSNVQVSGPTGAMAVVLLPIVASNGVGAVAVVALIAGAVLVVAAALRLGRYLAYIPWPVIEGFTLGIAVIIFLQQVPAALGAIESLLSAKVADGMTDGPPHDPDRELFGQGMANLASPLFGGMPATGAIARTAVNVRAGARTRMASIVHALVLVVVVLAAAGLVARIPLAALAGVLMVTAVRMVERHNIRAVLSSTRSDALVLGVTAVATVAFDLVIAIEVGMVVAAVLALRMLARSSSAETTPASAFAPEIDDDHELALLNEHIVVYRLDGALFFGVAQRFLATLSEVGDVRVVILRLPEVRMLDATGAQALGMLVETLEERGITVLLKGPRDEHMRVLHAVGVLDRLAHERHVFDDLDAAVQHARSHVTRALAPTA